MKLFFKVLMIVHLVILCACSDEQESTTDTPIIVEIEGDVIEETDAQATLREMVRISTNSPQDPPRIFQFNENAQLTKKINGDICILINRDNNGNFLSEDGSTWALTYDNNVLVSYSSITDTSNSNHILEYDQNKIIVDHYFGSDVASSRTVHTFQDDSYDKLLSSQTTNIESGETSKSTYYNYNGNNLIKIEERALNSQSGNLEPSFFYTFTYDAAINPFKKGLPENDLVLSLLPFVELGDYRLLAYGSDNNVIELLIENFIHNNTGTYLFNYEYNELNYPAEMVWLIGSEPFRTYNFEYY